MNRSTVRPFFIATVLLCGLASVAHADVWKWTDAHGEVHFVNTLTPIYTWVEDGRVFFADT
ncbi:MAG: DUF4124 domain-containing protein, partial [Gammaproteobacteria bacterium]|nr:DUF4124 domain-containing protein [Gammaproteobacteria bacterium]